MRIRSSAFVLVVACSVWACTQAAPPQPEPTAAPAYMPEDGDEEIAEIPIVAVIAPSEDMLRAALANDPVGMRDAAAVALTGCQASTTCPAEFGSCTTWSAPSQCDATCGPAQCFCRPVIHCEGEPPEPKGTDSYNSFRICFNAQQQPCTQWSKTVSTYCGC